MKRHWVRRTELKAVESERVKQMRAARVKHPRQLGTWLRHMFEQIGKAFRKFGEAIQRAAIKVVEFVTWATPVVKHQQHEQLASCLAGVIAQRRPLQPLAFPAVGVINLDGAGL